MYLGGYGPFQIAKTLADEKVLNPVAHWESKGIGRGGRKQNEDNPYLWGQNSVSKMLDNQRYCGDVINFQTYKPSYKSKKVLNVPKEKQKVFKDVHEAIISRDDFEKVQVLRNKHRRKRQQTNGSHNMFAGLLYCSECGNKLHQHRYNTTGEEYFNCSNYRGNNLKGTCETTHHIRMDYLSQVVLFEITKLIHFSKIYTDDFMRIILESTVRLMESQGQNMEKELKKLQVREKELDRLFERIYEDEVSGKISSQRFIKMSQKYETEQAELTQKIRQLQKEISKEENHIGKADDFIDIIKRYQDLPAPTDELVRAFINRIDVWNAEKQGSTRTQKIRIHYNCVGAIELPEYGGLPKPQIQIQVRQGVTATYGNYCSQIV